MRQLLETIFSNNKDLNELLNYIKSSDKSLSKPHKYSNYQEGEENSWYIIHIPQKDKYETQEKVIGADFLKQNDELKLNEITFNKYFRIKEEEFFVEFHIAFSENNESDFSIDLDIHSSSYSNSVWIEIDNKFEMIYSESGAISPQRHAVKDLLQNIHELNNPEINKAYFDLFVFNKPINSEIKDIIMLNTDLGTEAFKIVDKLGYDFRQDTLDCDIINNTQTLKHNKNKP